MPDVARIIFDGQSGGENSRDLPFDLDARTGQVAKLVNLIPGKNSIPRYGCPLIANTSEDIEIDWVYPFRSSSRKTIFIAKSGTNLVQIDENGETKTVKAGAFRDAEAQICAERIGDTVIIGNSYKTGAALAVTRKFDTLYVRSANTMRPASTKLSATSYNKKTSSGVIDTTDADYGPWWISSRTSRTFSVTFVRRDDELSVGSNGLPKTTDVWGNATSESWENISDRIVYEGSDSDDVSETKLTVSINAIPDGATHVRLWSTVGFQWAKADGPDAANIKAAGSPLRWWIDVSVYDFVSSQDGYSYTCALKLTEGQISGQTEIVDTTGANEIPPCSSLKFHNNLMWAGGVDSESDAGKWYFSNPITGAIPFRSLTLFNYSDRSIITCPDGTEKSTGIAASHGDLYFIGEKNVYSLADGDPINHSPTMIAQDMGSSFPNSIVERGQEIYYLSQQGPAVISGGVVEVIDTFDVAAVWPNPNGEQTYFHNLSADDKKKVRSWWCRGYWFISDGIVTVSLRMDRNQIVGGFTVEFSEESGVQPKLIAVVDESTTYTFGNKKLYQWTKAGVFTDGEGAYFTASVTYRRGRMDQRRKQKVGEAYDVIVHSHWEDNGQMLVTLTSQGGRGYTLYSYDERPITEPLQNTDVSSKYREVVEIGVSEDDNIVGSWFQVKVEKIVRSMFTISGAEVGVLLRKGQEFEYISTSAGATPPSPPKIDAGMSMFDDDMNRGYNG